MRIAVAQQEGDFDNTQAFVFEVTPGEVGLRLLQQLLEIGVALLSRRCRVRRDTPMSAATLSMEHLPTGNWRRIAACSSSESGSAAEALALKNAENSSTTAS